jgi:cbb3-type cytochrome oxidase subunit 3
MQLTNPVMIIWTIGYILMIGAVIAVLIWAFINNKKEKYDRARYLPLLSGIPKENEDKDVGFYPIQSSPQRGDIFVARGNVRATSLVNANRR